MKKNSFLLVTLLLLIFGCQPSTSEEDSQPADPKPETEEHVLEKEKPVAEPVPDFKSFLAHFIETKSMEDWPEDAQDPLVLSGEIYDDAKAMPLLRVSFTEISAEFNSMIPVEKLKQLVPNVPQTKNPQEAFRFYGFQKIKSSKHWLLSFFAYKLNRNENNEYHGHPFFLATFSPEGKFIDDYVWWTIEDDDLQVWNYVDVENEVLVVGNKENMNDEDLSEVWEKVEVNENGLFKKIYSNRPAASKF